MDYEKLAELLFPQIDKTPEDYYAMYPQRELPEGAMVTRICLLYTSTAATVLSRSACGFRRRRGKSGTNIWITIYYISTATIWNTSALMTA